MLSDRRRACLYPAMSAMEPEVVHMMEKIRDQTCITISLKGAGF